MNDQHDPNVDPGTSDPTVARLRSALDELTEGLGDSPIAPDAPGVVISLDGARRPPRRSASVLIGVAAAAALVTVGVAVVTLTRDDPAGPATSPTPTSPGDTLPSTVAPPPETVPPSTSEAPPMVVDLPRYTLGVEFGEPEVLATRPTDMLGMAWQQPETGNVLTLYVREGIAELSDGPGGEYYVPMDGSFPEEQGRAWVRGPEELGLDDGPSWMWWERPDGDVWMLTMHWGPGALSVVADPPLNARLTLRDWAFSIEPGSGLPYILPDDSWDVLSFQSPGPRNALSTVWTIDGHEVLLFTIEDGAVSGLNNLTSTMPIMTSALADGSGWLVSDGQGGFSAAGWITPDTNVWNVLQIPFELSERSHELVKKLRRAEGGDHAPVEVVDVVLPTFGLSLDLPGDVSSGYLVGDVWEDSGYDSAYWMANTGADRAIVRVVRVPGGGRGPEGDYQLDELSGDWIGEGGQAWILRTPGEPRYVPIELFWDRGDEVVLIGAYGLLPGDLEAVAQQAVASAEAWPNGLPAEIILPGDGSWDSSGAPRVLSRAGQAPVGSTYTIQDWTVDGHTVTVAVHSGGPQAALEGAWTALVVESVEVAGVYGWRAILPNNQTVVWWPVPAPTLGGDVGEAWVVVNISPALVQRADEIIAALHPLG